MYKPKYSLSRVNVLVILILIIFGLIYATVVNTVIFNRFGCTWVGCAHFVLFTSTTLQAMQCYLLTVVADPGQIPEHYEHDPEDLTATYIQVKKKGGHARYCQKCQRPKPPRAHHCSACGRCILRMDHHCPWTGNCIGHGNYKAFFLFLLYTELALTHACALLGWHVLTLRRVLREQDAVRTVGILVFRHSRAHIRSALMSALAAPAMLALAMPLAIGVGHLFAWHICLVLANKTTIEYLEGVSAHAHYRRLGQRFTHPYDVGTFRNVSAVLGLHWWRWLLPGVSAAGSGVSFPSSVSPVAIRTLCKEQHGSNHADQKHGLQRASSGGILSVRQSVESSN